MVQGTTAPEVLDLAEAERSTDRIIPLDWATVRYASLQPWDVRVLNQVISSRLFKILWAIAAQPDGATPLVQEEVTALSGKERTYYETVVTLTAMVRADLLAGDHEG